MLASEWDKAPLSYMIYSALLMPPFHVGCILLICTRFWSNMIMSIQPHLHKRRAKIRATMSWSHWKQSDPVPGVRPMFFKPKLHKESKTGFKTIIYRPSPVMIFSKNCFRSKKSSNKCGRFVGFWIFMAICMDKLDQSKKI